MDVQVLDILKWIGLVLVAGFIGYFGRYLAVLIIERIHKRKGQQSLPVEPAKEVSVSQDTRLEESKLKLEKKKAKQKAKKAKKSQKN